MGNEALEKPREVILERAKTSLGEVMASLNLEPGQREAFADQVRDVQEMMDRLERGVIHIAAFGMVSRGKSALLNALLGQDVFEIGPTHGTTRERQSARWTIRREPLGGGEVQSFVARPSAASECGMRNAECGIEEARSSESSPHGIQSSAAPLASGGEGVAVELIDTPGLNEVQGEDRAKLAREIARRADLLLFVVSGDMLRPEVEALAELREADKPIILVFNMIDLYPQADRDKIYEKIRSERVRELLKPDDVVMAAARPRPVKVLTRQADGSTAERWEDAGPVIVPLKLKILEVLDREGQALAALNTMLYVSDVHGQIVERRMELRDAAADKLIWRFTVTKAVAVCCNPVVVADVAGGIGTDIAMVFTLAKLYGIPMTRVGVGKLVIEIGKMAGVFTATEVGTHFLIGMAKSFFSSLAPFTGGASLAAYASVAPIQALAAGYSSRVIGEATKVYLRNGASWGTAGPKTVIQHILDTLDKDSIVARIKEELRARLRAG